MTENPDLRRAAVRGTFASTVGQSLRIPLQLASIVVLARLLTPNDYGLVAMVTAIIGIADIIRDLGLSAAAIRTVNLSAGQRSNLFWLNAGMGALLTLTTLGVAPLLAAVYRRPEVLGITLVLAPGFLLSGLATQFRVELTRRLEFHRLAMLDVIALAATVIGSICLAWLGHGYWSLVLPQLVIGPLTLVALVRMNGWMPGRWDRQTEVRSFMRLGMAYLMGGLLGYASKSLDLMVLGRQFGTEATGVYNRGTQLIRMPFTQLQTPFGSVLLPVLSRAADRGTNSLLNAVLHAQRAFAYPIAFGAGIVIAIPGEIIRVTLGSQWGGASWIVRATMLSVLLQAVAYPALWVFSAQGLARVIVSFNLLSAGISIAAIIVGSHWGPNGVATGTLISAALGAVVCLWFLRYRSGIPVGGLAFCGARILGLAGLATLAGIGASSLVGYSDGTAAVLSRIGIAILAAVITWSTAQLVPVVRSDFRAVLSLLLELRRR